MVVCTFDHAARVVGRRVARYVLDQERERRGRGVSAEDARQVRRLRGGSRASDRFGEGEEGLDAR